MANTKQAIKMTRKIKTRTKHNRWWKLQVKDSIKALLDSVTKTDTKASQKAMSTLTKKVDKAAKAGAIPQNKAKRIKSKYQKLTPSATKAKATKK